MLIYKISFSSFLNTWLHVCFGTFQNCSAPFRMQASSCSSKWERQLDFVFEGFGCPACVSASGPDAPGDGLVSSWLCLAWIEVRSWKLIWAWFFRWHLRCGPSDLKLDWVRLKASQTPIHQPMSSWTFLWSFPVCQHLHFCHSRFLRFVLSSIRFLRILLQSLWLYI